MNTPTFSADKSLYKSSRHYVTHAHTPILRGEIYPSLTTSVGGLGGGIGGTLGAWGCWSARCCKRYGICGGPGGGPGPARWCCKEYEDCERCIWPW